MKTLSFEGNGLEYFKIWIVNILLTIVTLGLYYPWAKVRNRRYLYANSTLEGRNFEYHATGRQLFFGYLFAMALFLTYAIVGSVSPVGSAVVFLIFIAALPWIIWRSLKFNMRMTSFSDVRFGFDGKLGGAYVNYLLLPIVFFLCLYIGPIAIAIAIPGLGEQLSAGISAIIFLSVPVSMALGLFMFAYMKKRNTHYGINGLRYGQGVFSTTVETGKFVKIFLKAAGLSLLSLFVMVLVVLAIGFATGGMEQLGALGNLEDTDAVDSALAGVLGLLIFVFYLGFIFLSLLIFAYSYTRQRTYVYANSSLDDKITFRSTLRARPMAWVMITNFLLTIFTLGLGVPWATVRMAKLVLENSQVDNVEDIDQYITQKQEEQSSLGDQIGDAFDVDVGVGF